MRLMIFLSALILVSCSTNHVTKHDRTPASLKDVDAVIEKADE